MPRASPPSDAPILAVTFDAAGTLITPARPVGETYARVAARHGATLDPDDLGRGFRAAFEAAPPMAFRLAGPALERAEREWWRRVVRSVVEPAGGVARFDPFFEDLYRHFSRGRAWRVIPGAPAVLSELSRRGLRLAMVSNFDSRLIGIVRETGLERWLPTVVYSTAAGSEKPDPAIFRAALERLEVDAAHALHVGDREDADGRGACSAGMRAAVVGPASDAPPPPGVHRIASVAEVPDLLAGAWPARARDAR